MIVPPASVMPRGMWQGRRRIADIREAFNLSEANQHSEVRLMQVNRGGDSADAQVNQFVEH